MPKPKSGLSKTTPAEEQTVNEVMNLLSGNTFTIKKFKVLKEDIKIAKDKAKTSIKQFLENFNDSNEMDLFNKSQEKFKIKRYYQEYGGDCFKVFSKTKYHHKYGRVIFSYDDDNGIKNVEACVDFIQEALRFLSNRVINLNEELALQKDITEQINSVI